MKYIKPAAVLSPRDFISNVRVLYDGGEDYVSVALLEWEGEECLAIRWNVRPARGATPKSALAGSAAWACPHRTAIPCGLCCPKSCSITSRRSGARSRRS